MERVDIHPERRFHLLICETIVSDVDNNKGVIQMEYEFYSLLI